MPYTYTAFLNEKQYFTHQNQRIAYLRRGDSSLPVVICVHGWLSNGGIWDHTMNALRDRWQFAAIDLLGHGHSDKPADGDYSIAAQAARVIALADHLGADKFTVLGHSMGGQIALYLAIHYPDRIARVIDVAGVAAGLLSAYIRWIIQPVFTVGARFPSIWHFSRFATRFPLYRAIFDYPIFHHFWNVPMMGESRELALIPGIEIPAYRDLVEIPRANLTGDLARIRVPVLIVFGRHDRTVPLVNGEIAHEQIPGSRFVILEDCGHDPMDEQPARYLEALEAFLST